MASAIDSVQRIPDLSIRSLIKFLQAPSTEPVAMGSGWQGLCEGSDELVFDTAACRHEGARERVAGLVGGMARGTMRRSTRAELRPRAPGLQPGALPGRVGAQARRAGGIDATATMARAGTLAGQL